MRCHGRDVPEVKFCGLTRAHDAAVAASLHANYAGVVFAGGPRLVDARVAREVFGALDGTPVQRVGVFAGQTPDEILRLADETALHVIQLHGGATLDVVLTLRERFGGTLWAAVGIDGAATSAALSELVELGGRVDAVVLDTAVRGRSGGTGLTFDWETLAPGLRRVRRGVRIVVAGGLRPSNVVRAVLLLAPDVVDVSSGVETAPGIKDPGLMRAFAAAVAAGARSREE